MKLPITELTAPEIERLAILSEELGEAQQAIGKILRHGYESHNPLGNTGMTNRSQLEREIGDVHYATQMLMEAKDVNTEHVILRVGEKAGNIRRWLHFQPPFEK